MAEIQLVMPKMGESVMEGTIIGWLKAPGDSIAADEAVLEVATDKVDTEVPAPQGGILKKILAKKGDVVPVGQTIAILETQDTPAPSDNGAISKITTPSATHASDSTPAATAPKQASSPSPPPRQRFYSPLVRSIARKEDLTQETLDSIPGTGQEGRLTKKDLFAYLEKQKQPPPSATTTPASHVPPIAAPEDEIIEMNHMRGIIAARMVASKQISAHVTSFVEADVTNLVHWRENIKHDFLKKEGEPITLTPLFVKATLQALRDFPMVNVSVSGNKIICHRSIHIGVAVALPTGNLIVPVLHEADKLSLKGLTLRLNDLARRARAEELKADELTGGTYTISNVGTFGNIMGTPIIMQPQCAIMAFGAVRKRPVVLSDPTGQDMIAIRHMMYLSHSYDHRVIDGALGGTFAKKVAEYLEQPPASQSF